MPRRNNANNDNNISGSLPQRKRNRRAVKRFNLRDIDVPYVGHQQSTVARPTSRIRHQAGKRAWATRIARYGPTGTKTSRPTRVLDYVLIPRLNSTNKMQQRQTGDGETEDLGQYKDNPVESDDMQDRHINSRATPISSRRSDFEELHASPPSLHLIDEQPDDALENRRQAADTVGLIPSSPPLPPSPHREPLAPLTAEDLRTRAEAQAEAEAAAAAQTNLLEMGRLLDERRASMLGPQDITRTTRRRRASDAGPSRHQAFAIFEDDDVAAMEGWIGEEEEEDEEDKENAPPRRQGNGTRQPIVTDGIVEEASLDLAAVEPAEEEGGADEGNEPRRALSRRGSLVDVEDIPPGPSDRNSSEEGSLSTFRGFFGL